MAEPSESRVNKAIIPGDLDRPAIDPGLSDIQEDRRYDAIEDLRAARAVSEDTTGVHQQSDSGLGTHAEKVDDLRNAIGAIDADAGGRDLLTSQTDEGLLESRREERWEAEHAADSGLGTHAEKVEDLRNAIDAIDTHVVDSGPQDITTDPMNFP
ncbi:MAG: hypothetical protein AUH85_17730 [Chloroflexi bacterium 13_1_40CM_4_68_4]|nr:MAG: hypothetical protein AUH85_17730 [Chloroflexi bacterium 13_1_40CM_4_68_4]